jgi:hypothetical protein
MHEYIMIFKSHGILLLDNDGRLIKLSLHMIANVKITLTGCFIYIYINLNTDLYPGSHILTDTLSGS